MLVLSVALVVLIIISGLFSSSETGMMSLNRYKLRHLARGQHRLARLVVRLLERPDRLLGVILIGNTLANNLASMMAVLLASHFFGGIGASMTVVSICLTLVLLIFAEVGPKTIAALFPQRVAFLMAYPLAFLLRFLYPFVWFTNTVSNSLIRLLGINVKATSHDELNREELRSLLHELKDVVSKEHQLMLLSILELEEAVVEEIMIPRNEVVGIDLQQPWSDIVQALQTSPYAYLPLYRGTIEQVVAMLQVRKTLPSLLAGELSPKRLLDLASVPYFIPEGTTLTKQLLEFKQKHDSIGLVVDEYGELCGLLTLEDILEQIVGEFTTNLIPLSQEVKPQTDGSYLIDGSVNVRELNRLLDWQLPTDGPKTLNGLIIEHLESLPESGLLLSIAGLSVEIISVEENRVKLAKITLQD